MFGQGVELASVQRHKNENKTRGGGRDVSRQAFPKSWLPEGKLPFVKQQELKETSSKRNTHYSLLWPTIKWKQGNVDIFSLPVWTLYQLSDSIEYKYICCTYSPLIHAL